MYWAAYFYDLSACIWTVASAQMELEKEAEVRRRARSTGSDGDPVFNLRPVCRRRVSEGKVFSCAAQRQSWRLMLSNVGDQTTLRPQPFALEHYQERGRRSKKGWSHSWGFKGPPLDKKNDLRQGRTSEKLSLCWNSHRSGNLVCCDVTSNPSPYCSNFHDQCALTA